ncbi:MAG: prolyl oligopeptidase family serine peptidase, partial [Gemmatimonadaceae bacterium]|nr:prolyl oligopeptidase family serine peptidase [Gemmatimonadaceae bacterium]
MSFTRCASGFVALASMAACAPTFNPATQATPAAGQALPATAVVPVQASPSLDRFAQQQLFKRLTDLSFMTQLSDEMIVKKVEYSGADKMTIPAYFFAPNDTITRHPVVIVVHGGVHGDFSDLYVPHVRSLVNEGYIVVAPEYRGSTGYGRSHYDAIDYGGKEVEDAIAARQYLADLVPNADLTRLA